jgi:hypothetical protein
MASQPYDLLTGGSGMYSTQGGGAATVAPPTANGVMVGASGKQHHGVIGLVLLAVLILIALDRAGFRFAVTAGRG